MPPELKPPETTGPGTSLQTSAPPTGSSSNGLKRGLRLTPGYERQRELLRPGDDLPRLDDDYNPFRKKKEPSGLDLDTFRREHDLRFVQVREDLRSRLTAERLAGLSSLPKKDGPSSGPPDMKTVIARWKEQAIQLPEFAPGKPGQDGKERDRKGDKGALWDGLVQNTPTIRLSSRKGPLSVPLREARNAAALEALERAAQVMKLDDRRVKVELADLMKRDGVEKGSEEAAEQHQPQAGWEEEAARDDPQWWLNLLSAVGGAFAFAVYDYIAFNEFAANKGDQQQLKYRLFQTPTQLFIHRWLSEKVSPASAAAFDVIWWTWGCDLMFYAIAQLDVGKSGWAGPGSFRMVNDDEVTWASWTPLGILSGLANLLGGRQWSEPLPGEVLYLQAALGFLAAVGFSTMTRAEVDEFLDGVGLGGLRDVFQRNNMDLYAAINTSLQDPRGEVGVTYRTDATTELNIGLGTGEKDGFYSTMGVEFLGEYRDWLLRVGLTMDRKDVGLYADWQQKVADWNLFLGGEVRDEIVRIGGGADYRAGNTALSGRLSWDGLDGWLAKLRIHIDL